MLLAGLLGASIVFFGSSHGVWVSRLYNISARALSLDGRVSNSRSTAPRGRWGAVQITYLYFKYACVCKFQAMYLRWLVGWLVARLRLWLGSVYRSWRHRFRLWWYRAPRGHGAWGPKDSDEEPDSPSWGPNFPGVNWGLALDTWPIRSLLKIIPLADSYLLQRRSQLLTEPRPC